MDSGHTVKMDPANSTARAQKRRRLHNQGLYDQPQFQSQYADNGDFEGECNGSQTELGGYDPLSRSHDLANGGTDEAALRAIL